MKDTFCSPALPCGSQLWEPERSSFPGSITYARTYTCQWEHSSACVQAHACLHACLLPAHGELTFMNQEKYKGRVWAPPWLCNSTPVRDTDGTCLGFTSHMGRAHKRHHLSLTPRTHRELVLRPPQPGELWCTRVEFCHNTAQSSSAAKSEQGACDSAKPEERNHFLAYLLKSDDVAHGRPPFLSFLPPTLHVSGPPTTHILLALRLRSVWLVPWGES